MNISQTKTTEDGALLELAVSILTIYAPYGLNEGQVETLAKAEVERWQLEKKSLSDEDSE